MAKSRKNHFAQTPADAKIKDFLDIDYLPPALVAALRGTVEDSEHRIARLLFKLAVETSMMMNVLAAGMEISEEDLRQLRARCVREVKQTNGNISLKDAVKYQKGQE